MRGNRELAVKEDGVTKPQTKPRISFRERRLWRTQQSTHAFGRTERSTHRATHNYNQESEEEDTSHMALSIAAREWFSKHGLEGFLRVADASPHEEPEKVAPRIDLEEITEGTIQALIGLTDGEL